MSTYYRRDERDIRERDWDSRTVVSRRDDRREEDSGYVTKKVYRIPAESKTTAVPSSPADPIVDPTASRRTPLRHG